MSKYFVLVVCALIVIAQCQKTGNENQEQETQAQSQNLKEQNEDQEEQQEKVGALLAQGQGMVDVMPEYVQLVVQFQEQGEDAQEVQDNLKEKVQKLQDAIKNNSELKQDDVQMQLHALRVIPRYQLTLNPNTKQFDQNLNGFQGEQNLEILLKNKQWESQQGQIVKQIADQGGRLSQRVQYRLQDEDVAELRNEITKVAVQDAFRNAAELAQQLALKIVGVRYIASQIDEISQNQNDAQNKVYGKVNVQFDTVPTDEFEQKVQQTSEFVKGQLKLVKEKQQQRMQDNEQQESQDQEQQGSGSEQQSSDQQQQLSSNQQQQGPGSEQQVQQKQSSDQQQQGSGSEQQGSGSEQQSSGSEQQVSGQQKQSSDQQQLGSGSEQQTDQQQQGSGSEQQTDQQKTETQQKVNGNS